MSQGAITPREPRKNAVIVSPVSRVCVVGSSIQAASTLTVRPQVSSLRCRAQLWARVSPGYPTLTPTLHVQAGVPSRHPLRARYPHCLQLELYSRGMCGRAETGAVLSTSHPAPYRQGHLDDQRRWKSATVGGHQSAASASLRDPGGEGRVRHPGQAGGPLPRSVAA
jgi:hypothetical protein